MTVSVLGLVRDMHSDYPSPLRLEGLDPAAQYRVREINLDGQVRHTRIDGQLFSGAAVMNQGFYPLLTHDYDSFTLEHVAEELTAERMQALYDEIKTPYKYGIVLQPEDGEKYDNANVFRKDGRWYMLYISFDGKGYETRLAVSDDLLHWKKLGCVLARAPKGAWDCAQVDGGPALLDTTWGGSAELGTYDGSYWMTYIGGALDGYETDPLAIGVAKTDDPAAAKGWTRPLDRPVLSVADPDVRPFEGKTLYKSFVFEDTARLTGGRFAMFYNAKRSDAWYESIGLAVSDDLLRWKRVGTDSLVANGPKDKFAISGDPMIQKVGDTWVMFYFGCGWGGQKGAFETFAASTDLVHWTKWTGEPLVAPGESWDKEHAHKPWVIKHNGIVYHFYTAVGDKGRALALATSKPLRVRGPRLEAHN